MKGTGKYIAVDCGKYNTKVSAYMEEPNKRSKFKFRTKYMPGTFDDDMFDRGTYIVQIDDGEVFKVGNDARIEPELTTSKKDEIHRICTMSAIAFALGEGDHGLVNVVIGIPLSLANIPSERLAYKEYILGAKGTTHTVKIKTSPNGPIMTSTFRFDTEYVYPEGLGVIYEYPARLGGTTAIIDIGNLNINNTYANAFTIVNESCFTDELGGKVLITGLAQELTSELGARVDDNLAASTLVRGSRDIKKRCLTPNNGDKELMEKSRAIIDNFLLDHVRAIKKKCDTRHWPLAFMNVVCIGGTSNLLRKELAEVFGENTFIPENPEYVNADGFLKKLCAEFEVDLEAVENADKNNKKDKK